jgi:hypothetical protein
MGGEKPMARLLGIAYSEQGYTCESCGHAINWKYTVQLDAGNTKIFGSDCAASILGKRDEGVLARRLRRAASQWNTHKQTHRDGETREHYINRRVAEMANAYRAWKAAVKAAYYPEPIEIIAELLHCPAEELPIPPGETYATALRRVDLHPTQEETARAIAKLLDAHCQKIDELYAANSLDWRGKAAYSITKI